MDNLSLNTKPRISIQGNEIYICLTYNMNGNWSCECGIIQELQTIRSNETASKNKCTKKTQDSYAETTARATKSADKYRPMLEKVIDGIAQIFTFETLVNNVFPDEYQEFVKHDPNVVCIIQERNELHANKTQLMHDISSLTK